MYCIYTDKDVPQELGNLDHIIPLSLGGCDEFVVWSEEAYNSKVGSSVDGAVAKDPFFVFALRDADVRGHSNKRATPVWKNTEIEGRPAQVTLGHDKVVVWDARDRRELDDAEVVGKEMKTRLRLDKHVATRFLAKVALGGGYFLYGDAFRHGADCQTLRELVLFDRKTVRRETFQNSKISICDRFHPDSQSGGNAHMYRFLCENLPRSIFIAVPHNESISFHVGIVGAYVGSIIVPADTSSLPNDGDHDLGHAVVLAPGDIQRVSYRELLAQFYEAINGERPQEPPRPFGEPEPPSA